MHKLSVKLSVFLATFLLAQTALAAKSAQNNSAFPFMPRANLDATVTTAAASYAEGDVMVPIYGSTNNILFMDVAGSVVTNNGWYGSLGAGYRQISGDYLGGGYVFGDYNRTSNYNGFWVLNPGVEVFTANWDLHINGYIPISDETKVMGATVPGSAIGIGKNVIFTQHKQYDDLYGVFEDMGRGADTTVGYTFDKANHTRVFGGAYLFNFYQATTNKMTGAMAGVEVPINKTITLVLRDSYDNVQKNTFAFTVRLTAGGLDQSGPNDVHKRLLDRIDRHIGTLGTGIGIPTQKQFGDTGQQILLKDDIAFFKPNGSKSEPLTVNSCTFENPCDVSLFNQATINSLNTLLPGTNFYLAAGQYLGAAPGAVLLAANPNFITLNNNQSVYGRTPDFKTPSYFQNQFPVLIGAINAGGNNNLQSFQLVNDGNQLQAVQVKNVANVTLDHVVMGDQNNLGNRYSTGLFLDGGRNVSMTHATIYGTSSLNLPGGLPALPGAAGLGVAMINSSNVYIGNSVINIDGSVQDNNSFVFGILSNGSDFTLANSTVNLNSQLNETQATPNMLPEGYLGIVSGVVGLNSNFSVINNAFNLNANGVITGQNLTSNVLNAGVIAGAIPLQFDVTLPISLLGSGNTTATVSNNSFTQTTTNTGNANIDSVFATNVGLAVIAPIDSYTSLTSSNNIFNARANAVIANGAGSIANIQDAAGIHAFAIDGGAVVVNTRNDVFNFTNTAIATHAGAKANFSRSYSVLVDATAKGTAQVNISNDIFNMHNNATAFSATFNDVASIGAFATNGIITVTAKNNVFNVNNQATVTDGANNYTYENIIADADAGGKIVINSSHNQYKLVINNQNVLNTSVNAIQANALNVSTSIVTINSTQDVFAHNISDSGDNVQIRVSAIQSFSRDNAFANPGGFSTVNLIADKFNINAQTTGINTLTSVNGVASGLGPMGVINLSQGNIFNVQALQNGMATPNGLVNFIDPFQQIAFNGVISNDGTTQFNVMP